MTTKRKAVTPHDDTWHEVDVRDIVGGCFEVVTAIPVAAFAETVATLRLRGPDGSTFYLSATEHGALRLEAKGE